MSTNGFYILLGSLGGVTIAFGLVLFRMHQRIQKLTRGKSGADLESTISDVQKHIGHIEETERLMAEALENIDGRLATSIRAVEMERFNPFGDQGGNHSFAISLITEKGDGIVLSSLYSRERMSIFAKPVKDGTSSFELTEEEERVLAKGINRIKT